MEYFLSLLIMVGGSALCPALFYVDLSSSLSFSLKYVLGTWRDTE